MTTSISKKSLFAKKNFQFELNEDLEFQQSFESFLGDYSVSSNDGKIVNGVIVDIEDKGRNSRVFFDIGNKTEGSIAMRSLNQPSDNEDDEEEDSESDSTADRGKKVGDIVRLYVEDGDPKNGYAILNREKVIREEMWAKLEESFANAGIVNGYIVSKVKCGFVVDLYGAIAFLPGSQLDLRTIIDINPLLGRKQPFLILKMDKTQGNIVVSRRAVLENNFNKQRHEILNTIEEGQILEGIVKNVTKYGAFIDLGGVDGLAHIVDLSWKKINHPFEVISLGQRVRVKVIKFVKETKRISLGIKQLEESPWDRVHENYPIESKHQAIITSIADYGIFAELAGDDGIEGLVYQNDISWSRKINGNPSRYYQKGQKIEVKILDIDEEKFRVSLSVKNCIENPWFDFVNKYNSGQIIEVTVKNVVDFGIFAELPETIKNLNYKIEGLINYQDCSWGNDNHSVAKSLKKGDVIKVKILTMNPEKERISLGIKQIEHDPMENMILSLQGGQIIDGTVVNIINNDVFVELKEGVEIVISKNDSFNNSEKMDLINSLNLYSKVKVKIIDVIPQYRLIKSEIIKKL